MLSVPVPVLLFRTVTVTSAVASSTLSAETVSVYSYVSSAATSSGTSNVGFAIVVLLNLSVFDVVPRAVQAYAYEEPGGAPEAEQSNVMSSEPS